jgi:cytochrome c oxidase subunit 1
MVLGLGYVIMAGYLIWSLIAGKKATGNPWEARGLEWETASPPPTHNFHEQPVVRHPVYAYEYASETSEEPDASPENPHG